MQIQTQTQQTLTKSATPGVRTAIANGFSLMQVNGTKVYGPPDDWIGAPPSSSCELYIHRIPRNTSEHKLLELLLQFGKIYQFRVPIYIHSGIRGFAFVRYTNEDDAECAMEVLQHFIVGPRKTLNVVNSYEKCRLFVKNIPKHLTELEIDSGLRMVFPNMKRIYSSYPKKSDGNMGFVFVVFATHEEALKAKRKTSPGTIRLWEEDVEVVWAATDGHENALFNKTLFFRDVNLRLCNNELENLIAQYVDRTTIKRMSKSRLNTFVEFNSRQVAESVMQQMQGIALGNSRLIVNWAKPSTRQRLCQMRNADFDALLRLKCIANSWKAPVIMFGAFFEVEEIQYAAVLLRNEECKLRLIIVTLRCRELIDIQSRLCEVVVSLIDTTGIFPDCNYVFCAEKDTAHLLGVVVFSPHATFIASNRVPERFSINVLEILDVSRSCALLAEFREAEFLQVYENSCVVNKIHTYPIDWIFGHRILGPIQSNYRGKPPLKHNLTNTQIVLALCFLVTGRNFSAVAHSLIQTSKFDIGQKGLPYIYLPLSTTQYNFATKRKRSCCSAVLLSINPVLHAKTPLCCPKKLSKAGAAITEQEMTISHQIN